MKRFLRLFLAVIVMLCAVTGGTAMAAGKKVALIIGNSNYVNGASLPNPLNDAALVTKAAIAAGFEVTSANNLNADDFHNSLTAFRAKADTAEVSLVYYAGHGIENNAKNWLIPTDATLSDPRDLQRQAISFDEVLNTVALSKFKIILLDACRDDPYKAKWPSLNRSFVKGLASIGEIDNGSIILFATDAGMTVSDGGSAGNSYFATAISKNLAKPGEPLSKLANNIAGYVDAVSGGLQRPMKTERLPADYTLIEVIREDSSEYAVWGKATKLNSIPAYEEYLNKFPNGQFKSDALTSIRVLSRSGPAPLPPSPYPPTQTTQFKMLPGLGAAPQFFAGLMPSCRDSWNGLPDATSKLAAIDSCLGAYKQYESGTLSPFTAQIADHVRQVQSLASNTVEPDPDFTDAQKAEFRASVQSRVQDASQSGALMQGYLSAKKSVEDDTAALINAQQSLRVPITPPLPPKKPCDDPFADKNNCIAVTPPTAVPAGSWQITTVRTEPIEYGSGLPSIPAAPLFSFAGYPTCKDNWRSVTNVVQKVEEVNNCIRAYTAYQTSQLNSFRESMNAHLGVVHRLYSDNVGPNFSVAEALKNKFFADMKQRDADIADGGRLMADYERAKAHWAQDNMELREAYNISVGCGGHPTPEGLAKSPC